MEYKHEEGTVFFEERFEQTLTIEGINELWEEFYPQIERTVNVLAYRNGFSNRGDLMSFAYLKFVEKAKIYDPYYEDGFYPFENYIFKQIVHNVRSYIQSYFMKANREPCTENIALSAELNEKAYNRKTLETYYSLDLENALAQLPERTRGVLEMTMDGYTQEEIAKRYNITQSRVSAILKSVKTDILRILDNKKLMEEKTVYPYYVSNKTKNHQARFKNYKELIEMLENAIRYKIKQKPVKKRFQRSKDYD